MPDDSTLPQNFIEWTINPRTRTVAVDTSYGTMPLHLKHGDDFDWRIRFKVGDGNSMQLANLESFKFILLEKGRFDGQALAEGEADLTWDDERKCYHMAVTLDAEALNAALAIQDALSTGFADNGYDCTTAAQQAAGTTTTTTTSGSGDNTTHTSTTAPATVQPQPPSDIEFMGEFEWRQAGKTQSSVTFSLFVARDLIKNATGGSLFTPPPDPVDWRSYATLKSDGTAFTGEHFGYFRAPLQLEVLSMQVAVQQPDPAHGFRLQLTDAAGANLPGFFGDVPANASFVNLPLATVLALNEGQEIRAKVLNYTGDSAAAVTVNLVCRQYVNTQPSGPSGGPGVVAAEATALPPGSAATATVVNGTLKVGIPKGVPGNVGPAAFNQVHAHAVGVGQPPTAALTAGLLELGIPAGAKGDPGAAGSYIHSVNGGDKVYSPADPTVATCTFVGVGKLALVLFGFQHSSAGADVDRLKWFVYRDGEAEPVVQGSETQMAHGAVRCFSGQRLDPGGETPVGEVTYSLKLYAYNNTSGGLVGVNGSVQNPNLTIIEIG